jgi:hypothetical protein
VLAILDVFALETFALLPLLVFKSRGLQIPILSGDHLSSGMPGPSNTPPGAT